MNTYLLDFISFNNAFDMFTNGGALILHFSKTNTKTRAIAAGGRTSQTELISLSAWVKLDEVVSRNLRSICCSGSCAPDTGCCRVPCARFTPEIAGTVACEKPLLCLIEKKTIDAT